MWSGGAGRTRRRPTCHRGTWNSTVPRLAAQIRPGVSQITPYSTTPPSVFDGTDTRFSQSGACTGTCFSKKWGPSTPLGKRFMVRGRSRMWASMIGATRR